jgi:hypothetical protein
MRKLVPELQRKLHVDIERQHRKSTELSAQHARERMQTEVQSRDCEAALRDVFNAKKIGHSEREVAFDIRSDVADDAHTVASVTANYHQCMYDVITLQTQINAATITLRHLEDGLNREALLISSSHAERERMSRKLHSYYRKNAALNDDIGLLAFLAEGMKREIRDRDCELVDQRVTTCEFLASAEETGEVVARLEKLVADLSDPIGAAVIEITDRVHTKGQLEVEIDTLNHDNRTILKNMAALLKIASTRAEEHSSLCDKARLLGDHCRMRAARFQEKLSEIGSFEIELRRALDRQSQLILSRRRADLVQVECGRLRGQSPWTKRQNIQ